MKKNNTAKFSCVFALIVTVLCLLPLFVVSSFATIDGTFADAKAITVNREYQDNISAATDKDFYEFTLASSGKITISFSHKNLFDSNEYWCATIYDGTTKNISSFSFSGTDTSVTTYAVGLAKGTYYLRITGGYMDGDWRSMRFDTGAYSFKVNYSVSSHWEKENKNETIAEAPSVKVNTKYYGSIGRDTDRDYYRFVLPQAGAITINFGHSKIYDTEEYFCYSVIDTDTNEICWFESAGTDTSANSPLVGLPAGTYYLKVTGGHMDGDWRSMRFSAVTYNFTVTYTEGEYYEKELNENYSSATAINLGKTYQASVNDAYDKDYYKLNITKTTNVKVSFTHSAFSDANEYWCVTLFNDNTDRISFLSVPGTKSDSLSVKLSPGIYYVKVTGGHMDGEWRSMRFVSDTYKLCVSAVVTVNNPTGFRASSATTRSIKLAWNKVSGAAGYRIYKYSSSTGKYTRIASVTGTTYTVKNLKAGKIYTYYIKAYKTVDGKTYLSPKYIKLRAATKTIAPKTPILFSSSAKVYANWTKVTGATGYELYYKKGSSGTYKRAYHGTKLSFTKSSLTKGSTYYFKLRTYKTVDGKKVYSAYSSAKPIKVR